MVRKTKETKDRPKKSKVKNDSNIFFEMNKRPLYRVWASFIQNYVKVNLL